jgi:hypothetical protein
MGGAKAAVSAAADVCQPWPATLKTMRRQKNQNCVINSQ